MVSRLGAGAMAGLFAEHPRINKRVAIKVIHHELASNRRWSAAFFTEARAASQINHENVVDILDFGQTPEGDNFMVMEYLDGQTISSRLRAAGHLNIRWRCITMQQSPMRWRRAPEGRGPSRSEAGQHLSHPPSQ